MKKTGGLGGFKLQLTADCFFYLQRLAFIVSSKLVNRFPRLVTLSNGCGPNAGSGQDRASK